MHAADIHEKALFFIFLVASLSFCKNQHAKNPSSRNLKANQHIAKSDRSFLFFFLLGGGGVVVEFLNYIYVVTTSTAVL